MRGFYGIIACLSSIIVDIRKKFVLYANTKIIERAFSVYWYIKYKIPSVYAQKYGGKYFIEDFKWASFHLLPTHPKLFITAWHLHVAAKWQILIKQSFQRFFGPLSGRNSKLYRNETTSKWERVSLLRLWIRFQPYYICFLEWNWIAKMKPKI